MTRRKTTVYLDAEVLTAAKVLAATREQTESQVVEDALRVYLRSADCESARADLRALLEGLAADAELDDDEAMEMAVQETRAVRTARRARQHS